jgi:hypothetical protein
LPYTLADGQKREKREEEEEKGYLSVLPELGCLATYRPLYNVKRRLQVLSQR